MTTLRIPLITITTLAALAVSGCGADPEPVAADVPQAGAPDTPAERSLATRGPVTVLDDGTGPELCLGGVAKSYPPQCDGPPLVGWRWAEVDGPFERVSGVRWGDFVVTGRYDGTSFTVTEAVSAALVDPVPVDPEPPLPDPERDLDADQLQALGSRLSDELPGVLGWYAEDGRLLLDVVHDDGGLQTRVEESYGAGVVEISSALVPVG